jgi:hypothetical protein
MFFLVLVTLGTVTLELNPQKKLEYVHPKLMSYYMCKRCCHQHSNKTFFSLSLLVYMGKLFRLCMFG